jgi:hypothetical protein
MIPIWLQLALMAGFSLGAWISSLDANSSALDTYLLCGIAALTGAHLAFRLLRRGP